MIITDTKKIRTGIFVAAIFLFAIAAPVKADWDPGDSYKMHFPQLPDPNGTAVSNYNNSNGEPLLLADDWLCTETGPVTDIHIWGSWKEDSKGEIEFFNVSIWSDFPDNDGPGDNFSYPNELLWQHTFSKNEFTERYWSSGTQNFTCFESDPLGFVGVEIDIPGVQHDTWQYNLHINPATAFVQEEGTIYWLALSPQVNSSGYQFGWKTSQDEWQDPPVINLLTNPVGITPGIPCVVHDGMNWTPPALWWNFTGFPELEPELGLDSFAFVINGPPQAPEVPLLTPTGLIALGCLLSAIAAVTLVRKRR